MYNYCRYEFTVTLNNSFTKESIAICEDFFYEMVFKAHIPENNNSG